LPIDDRVPEETMMRRAWFGGFGVGLLAGTVGAVAMIGGHAEVPARAQAEAQDQTRAERPPVWQRGATGRYQVSSWAHPGAMSERGSMAPSFGAYVLDTETGKLWLSRDGGELQQVRRGK
jgi:hypothetical protein